MFLDAAHWGEIVADGMALMKVTFSIQYAIEMRSKIEIAFSIEVILLCLQNYIEVKKSCVNSLTIYVL